MNNYIIKIALTNNDFLIAKKLFLKYSRSIKINLKFQHFESELNEIDIQYNRPDGGLILMMNGEEAIGCIGVRKLENNIAEFKRMFVLESYRNKGIGTVLLQNAIKIARDLGYEKIRLDTLESMRSAIKLYIKYGFYEIGAYRYNPHPDSRYFELDLVRQ